MKRSLVFILAIVGGITSSGIAQSNSKQRLIAKAEYTFPNGLAKLQDSVFLKYSGSRNSIFDHNRLEFFDLHETLGNAKPVNLKRGRVLAPNNIDSSTDAQYVAYDELKYYQTPYKVTATESCVYSADGKVLSILYKYGLPYSYPQATRNEQYSYFYDDLVRITSTSDSLPANINGEARFLIRNYAGQIVIDSTISYLSGVPEPNSVVYYEYDAQGRYISRVEGDYLSGSLNIDRETRYDYYGDGKVRTITIGDSRSGSFVASEVDSFGYTPGVPGYTMRIKYQITQGQVPVAYYQYRSHVNSAGLKDTATFSIYQSPFLQAVAVEYNSFGNPVVKTIFQQDQNTGNNILLGRHYYYYETYEHQLDVASRESHSAITRAPNPTTGAIRLQCSSGIKQKRASVVITNSIGQSVFSDTFSPACGDHQIRLGSEILPGVYGITVLGDNNVVMYSGTFQKR